MLQIDTPAIQPVLPVFDSQTFSALKELCDDDDSFLATLIEAFIEDASTHIATLQTALSTGHAAQLEQTAHTLKSSSAYIGAAGMAKLCEQLQTSIVPQQALEHDLGACRGQRVEPELNVVGLIAPAVLVLGAVVDQEEQAGSGQALHQAIEERLSLGIDPMEVLEHQHQGLHLALPQEQAFEGVQGALAALRRIEGLPGCILHRHL